MKEVVLGGDMGHVCVNLVNVICSSLRFQCGAFSVLLDLAEICSFGVL